MPLIFCTSGRGSFSDPPEIRIRTSRFSIQPCVLYMLRHVYICYLVYRLCNAVTAIFDFWTRYSMVPSSSRIQCFNNKRRRASGHFRSLIMTPNLQTHPGIHVTFCHGYHQHERFSNDACFRSLLNSKFPSRIAAMASISIMLKVKSIPGLSWRKVNTTYTNRQPKQPRTPPAIQVCGMCHYVAVMI